MKAAKRKPRRSKEESSATGPSASGRQQHQGERTEKQKVDPGHPGGAPPGGNEAEEAKQEAEDAKSEAQEAKQEAEDAKKEAEDAKEEAEDAKKRPKNTNPEATATHRSHP